MDFVFSENGPGVGSPTGAVLWATGDGAGNFTLSPLTIVNDSAVGVAAADFTSDGKTDLVVQSDGHGCAGAECPPAFYVFVGDGLGGLPTVHRFVAGIDPEGVTGADFNHNGQTDLAISLAGENKVRIFYDDVLPTLSGKHVFDIDGDGRTDIAVYRDGLPSVWYWLRSSDNTFQYLAFGQTGDIPVPGEYNGGGFTTFSVYRPSTNVGYVSNYPATTYFGFPWGLPGDIPVPGDYDGDRKDDIAVYRPSAGTWYVAKSTGGQISQPFGAAGDKPVPADYDGDGKTDFALFHAGATTADPNIWFVMRSSQGNAYQVNYGIGGDLPVPGDYDGDLLANIAVFRPSTGYWYTSFDPATNFGGRQWGQNGDLPLVGDYDADGKIDFSVFRPGTGGWYISQSTNGAFVGYAFGLSTDKPVPATRLP